MKVSFLVKKNKALSTINSLVTLRLLLCLLQIITYIMLFHSWP